MPDTTDTKLEPPPTPPNEVSKLKLEEGDVLVIKLLEVCSDETLDIVRREGEVTMRDLGLTSQVVVLAPGVELGVIKAHALTAITDRLDALEARGNVRGVGYE